MKIEKEIKKEFEYRDLILKAKIDLYNLINKINIQEERKDLDILLSSVDDIFKPIEKKLKEYRE